VTGVPGSCDWTRTTLGKCAEWVSGGTPPKSNPAYWGGDIPWVSAKDMKEFRLYDSQDHVTPEALGNGTRSVPPRSILLLVRGMTLHDDLPICMVMREMTFNQDVKALVPNQHVVPEFLAYWLLANKPDLLQLVDSASHGTGRIHTPVFKDTELRLPPPSVQQRIADVLGKLDDKNELNRRMNRTLEKMAAAIFKSWFIDFDPTRAKVEGRDPNLPAEIADLFPDIFEDSELGPIPKGWDVKPLDEIADYLNGLACQKHPAVKGQKSLPVIKIRELRQGITGNTDRASIDVPPKYIVEDGDILFSWSGSLLVTIWCGGRGVLNQHVFKVTSTSFPKWFFYQATKHHLDEFRRIASDKATTMGHIKRHHLTDATMAIPDKKLMERSTEVLGTLLARRINALRQVRVLALTRDALLPKLLTGAIELPEAEELVTGVT